MTTKTIFDLKKIDVFWFIGEMPKDPNSAASQSKEVEEKKHKKKHKKRSSKHGHSEKPTEEQQ